MRAHADANLLCVSFVSTLCLYLFLCSKLYRCVCVCVFVCVCHTCLPFCTHNRKILKPGARLSNHYAVLVRSMAIGLGVCMRCICTVCVYTSVSATTARYVLALTNTQM
jgi:hypothetical protein